ncbi:glycosyltransferase family A protein [Escherichia coli]|uniref:glycosyltransferase family A protein n=1 Tax=Escherichia coli TaxID=562 RepID=UPI000BDF9052|nr:glycosyltransferase family 2 protein [Escherichia coli]
MLCQKENEFSKLISIVMPVYNVQDYIVEAIDSIINQSMQPHSVIIVDDGSGDDSIPLLKKRIEGKDNYKIFSKENGGLSSARNYGLTKVSTPYVYFFDSDDALSPMFIRDINEILTNYKELDIIAFSGSILGLPSNLAGKIPSYKRTKFQICKSGDVFLERLFSTNSYFSSVCINVFRTELLLRNSFFKNIVHEDEEYLPRIILDSKLCYCTDEIYFYRRVRENSIMTSKISSRNIIGYLEVLKTYRCIIQTTKNKLVKYYLKKRYNDFLIYIFLLCKKNKIFLPKNIEQKMNCEQAFGMYYAFRLLLIKKLFPVYHFLYQVKNR